MRLPSGVKTLALIETPGHVSARYRIQAFAPALAAARCELQVAVIPRGAVGRLRLFARLKPFDAIILQRRLFPPYQLRFLQRRAKRLIFDFDDAVFCNDSYSPKGIDSSTRQRRFACTVRDADAITAGNEFLRDEAIASGAHPANVFVMPTCVEPSDYQRAEHRKREGTELVWIGSSSTLQGLERERNLFAEIGARFPNLRLRLICDRFPNFARPPIIQRPWSSATEASDLAAGDIGTSWIPDDRWSRGKCGLKLLQYYASGLPVIANPVGVHPKMIQSGVTGFLASDREEWCDAIDRLASPDVRRRMGRAAREYVETHYAVARHAGRFVEIVIGR